MRAFGFLATLVVLVIVTILTLKNLKKAPARSLEDTTGIDSVPGTLTEIPAFARDKVNEALKQGAERNEKAMQGVE